MSDDALDRALADAVDVRPSPEFLAKVRHRVTREHQRRQRSLIWLGLAAAASAVLVIGAAVMWRSAGNPRVSEAARPPLVAVRPSEALVLAPAPAPAAETGRLIRQVADTSNRGESRRDRAAADVLSEVMISEAERRGFQLLLVQLQRGSMPPVAEEPSPELATIGPPPIAIEAIAVEAFPAFESPEGETR